MLISSFKRLKYFFDKIKDTKIFADEKVLEEYDDLVECSPQITVDLILLSIEKHRPVLFKLIVDRMNGA